MARRPVRLRPRLAEVAKRIRGGVHADLGSDHGRLLRHLLESSRIEHAIAIEINVVPWQHSRDALSGLSADVRHGDGLAAIEDDDPIDSLSVCGMGGKSIARILTRHPDRLPGHVILQPNDHSEAIRRWGLRGGFHLIDEARVGRKRRFEVLEFRRGSDRDPAYEIVAGEGALDEEVAIHFGPHFIRRRDPDWLAELQEQREYLEALPARDKIAEWRYRAIELLLAPHSPESWRA
ncbi:MAG: tRNA (adenine(22)-N(1))-methyltransferase TrmK [Planctomycetota bacterium]